MQLRKLLQSTGCDDRAVSPVIGVILMVAITVILAAVIGTFVLGLGDQVQQTSPNAQFSYDFDGDGNVTITHDGGDGIDADRLHVTSSNGSADWSEGGSSADRVTAGVSFDSADTDVSPIPTGDTVRVVWTAPDGDRSSTLASRTAP